LHKRAKEETASYCGNQHSCWPKGNGGPSGGHIGCKHCSAIQDIYSWLMYMASLRFDTLAFEAVLVSVGVPIGSFRSTKFQISDKGSLTLLVIPDQAKTQPDSSKWTWCKYNYK
jgi:hypothetical protein